MQFTYYGHACFAMKIAGKNILFDPFISDNPLAKGINVNAIEADYILVSHGHGDHVAELIQIAKNTDALVMGAYEIMEWTNKQGVSNTHPMNFGGKVRFDWGTVRFVPATHSSVLPDGTYGGNPGGFVVSTKEGSFYYSGDTALMMDMQLIPRYAKVDVAILPIGDNFTMGVEDALVASEFAQCATVVGVHFDTFGYIKINHEEAIDYFKKAGKNLILPEIGKTISI